MIAKEQRQELRALAEEAAAGGWGPYVGARTFDPHYASKAKFIAAISPGVVLALLDGLESAPAAPAYEARDIEVIRQEFEDSLCRAFDEQPSALEELRKRDPDGDYSNMSVRSFWWDYRVGDMLKAVSPNEGDRQLILLALANLALLRPGFGHALQTLSGQFGLDGAALFEYFKDMNRHHVGAWPYPPSGDAKLLPLRPTGEGDDE